MSFNLRTFDPLSVPPDEQLLEISQSDCEESFYFFLKSAWRFIDPAPWCDGWHIEAICEHLQAVADGQIRKLVINLPPRHGKSLILSVAFPAWAWAQQTSSATSGPTVPFLYASYADRLSLRDSVKCRRLIESPWYQARWGDRFKLTSDQNTKARFTNDRGGERLITSIDAGVTGEGGNCLAPGTMVATPEGEIPIEQLRPGDQVFSFDISQEKVVTCAVVATTRRRSNDVVTIHSASGRTLKCTRDHKIYSAGRGFVEAGRLGRGHRFVVANTREWALRAKDSAALVMCGLQGADRSQPIRTPQDAQTERGARVLRQILQIASPLHKKFKALSHMWHGCIEQARSVLLGCLQKAGVYGTSKEACVPGVLGAVYGADPVLFAEVRGQSARAQNARLRELEVPRPDDGEILIAVRGNEIAGPSKRSAPVRVVQRTAEACQVAEVGAHEFTCASYQRKLKGQPTSEPGYAMPAMSPDTPSWEVEDIAGTAGDSSGEVDVYDIQVEGQSNFFAEGILVHNCIIVDDPNSANDVASEASLKAVIDWWQTALSTRANDPENAAWVIIQQRLAEDDLTGHILEHEADGWTHLMLPGRYEPERSFPTSIGWKDPRTEAGEPLWPERFSERALANLERIMGPYTFAGQIMQRPEPKGGGIIKREWWKLWEPDSYPPMDFIMACLDTAYTEDTMNDPSGMIVWGIYSGDVQARTTQIVGPDGELMRPNSTYSEFAPKVMCMYAFTEHLELSALVEKVAQLCVKMKVDLLKIENKASGHSVAQEIQRLYSRERFGVQLFDPKSQDKTARLYSVQHLFAEGIVYAPDRPWMEKVITQVGQFPKSKHDEYVDCTSMGLRTLRDMGLLVRQPEREAELEESRKYRGQEQPLYNC